MYDFLIKFKFGKSLEVESLVSEELMNYVSNEVEIKIFGNVINSQNVFDKILDNEANGDSLTRGIFGKYTIIYVNYNMQKIIVESDYFGGYKNVYYTKQNENYYIFSSIRCLKNREFNMEFNYAIVDEFIYNGVIKTKDTLFCGIYKLLPNESIVAESSSIGIIKRPVEFFDNRYELNSLLLTEKDIISEYIEKLQCQDSQEINITLSSGYDSNFLLHIIENLHNKKKINAFTCGGERGVDETSIAENIAGIYGNVKVNKCVVGNKTLNCLMDIAERLEGAMYERGIFLQYEIASTLNTHGVKCIMLGECADQVFNINFYEGKEKQFLMNYIDNPYELGALIVLKKSSLMLDSFGIVGLYPFTDRRMIDVGYCTRIDNGVSKEYQKKMCCKVFNPQICDLVEKKPGSTSLCSLFADEEAEHNFIDYVKKNNEFYNPAFRISYKYETRESELDYYICLEYLACIKKIFCT